MYRSLNNEILVVCGAKTPDDIRFTFSDENQEWMDRCNAFWDDYKELCQKHDLMLESDDPYCGLDIVKNKLDRGTPYFSKNFLHYNSEECNKAHEKEKEWSDEKWDEECKKVFGEVLDFDIWSYMESDKMPPKKFGSPELRKLIKKYQDKHK